MGKSILLAYSYQKNDPTSAPKEEADLRNLLRDSIMPSSLFPSDAPLETVFEPISSTKDDIQIFHYAGHAYDDTLPMSERGDPEFVQHLDIIVFAEIIKDNGKNLKLIFLNACNTAKGAEHLVKVGNVPTVIGTTIPVKNKYAHLFAIKFYDLFVKQALTIGDALKQAHDRMNLYKETTLIDPLTKQLNPEFIDEERGPNIKKPVAGYDSGKIYQAFGDTTQKFADWPKGDGVPNSTTATGAQSPSDKGLQKDAYLLCNRSFESKDFESRVLAKLNGANTDPQFIFINSHLEHGPFDLVLRFEKYILQRKWATNFRSVEHLEFPEAAFFDIEGDEKKALKCLEEIYKQQLSQKMEQKFPPDCLLVLCHKIPNHFWKPGIHSFFEYYVKVFSKILQCNLSERLIIVGLLQHLGRPNQLRVAEKYETTFKDLEACCPNQVKYYAGLPLIQDQHLIDWYEAEVKTGFDLRYTPEEEEMPYFIARGLMEKIILDHNA